jgi:hypothetical protein
MTTHFYKFEIGGGDYTALLVKQELGVWEAFAKARAGQTLADAMKEVGSRAPGGWWCVSRKDCDTVGEKKRRLRDLREKEDDRDEDEANTECCHYFDGDDVDDDPPAASEEIDDTTRMDYLVANQTTWSRSLIDFRIREAIKAGKWKTSRKSSAAAH